MADDFEVALLLKAFHCFSRGGRVLEGGMPYVCLCVCVWIICQKCKEEKKKSKRRVKEENM